MQSEKESTLFYVLNALAAQRDLINNPNYINDEFNKGRLYQQEIVMNMIRRMIREEGQEDE
jgi:hypothetical protein